MKKLLFGLISMLMLGIAGHAQERIKVGVVENGNFIITEDLSSIKKDWNELLSKQHIESEIVSFSIKNGVDVELNNEVYVYLLGSNRDDSVKMARQLLRLNNTFYFEDESIVANITVTCAGCAYSCDPVKTSGRWYCTPNCGSNCTKTVTITGGGANAN